MYCVPKNEDTHGRNSVNTQPIFIILRQADYPVNLQ